MTQIEFLSNGFERVALLNGIGEVCTEGVDVTVTVGVSVMVAVMVGVDVFVGVNVSGGGGCFGGKHLSERLARACQPDDQQDDSENDQGDGSIHQEWSLLIGVFCDRS